MKALKCMNCGGQLKFGGAGSLICTFCGSTAFMSDADFRGHEAFRAKLLSYYKAEADRKEFDYSEDTLWTCHGADTFAMDNGRQVTVEFMEKYPLSGGQVYLAKEHVVYLFHECGQADLFLSGLRRLVFPEADVKLYRCFPALKQTIPLQSGGTLLVFVRRPFFYPAEMFSPFRSEHLAWVISRMENFCCALTYSGIEHGDISPLSVWINPVTHEGALYGDWRKVRSLTGVGDLTALRRTAIELALDTSKPREMYAFLNSSPCKDAFEDFSRWDQVIVNGFGGHKFIRM